MKMTKALLSLAVAASVATPVMADISANIGATSNYLWRGVTQTQDEAAISGGVDFEAASGFYAGTWVSNVDFGDGGGNETDLYFGLNASSGDLSYTLGLIYYMYTQYDESNFTEIHGDIEYMGFSAGLYYTIDAEWDGGEDNLYGYLSYGADISDGWSWSLTLGHNEPDEGEDYQHYQLDFSKSAGDYGDFTLTFSQTNDYEDDEDLTPVVSWSKSF